MNDLDRAITTKEKAVQSALANHPNRAGMLNYLGSAL